MSCFLELKHIRQQGMAEDPHKLTAMVNKSQRLVLGISVLLLVDIIWVSSSELMKYYYQEPAFNKPFFSTYVKTSMFSLYLLGLCFWPAWREQWSKPTNYMFIDPNAEDEHFYSETNSTLSDPLFVPIKTPEPCDRSSSTESDDSSVRSVRFSKLAEVRHMSENDATEALLSRLSYQASVRAGEQAKRQANKLSIPKVAKIAFGFCFLWFIANYTHQSSLSQMETGIVTVLASTCSLFTLFLAACFPSNSSDKFTLSNLVAVSVSIFGLVLVALSDLEVETNRVPAGVILALISALFYAIYVVFLRRRVDHEDKIDIPIFFGFVGFYNLLFLWPIFFILHYGHWEEFEWPSSYQWTFLLINGLIGTVISEVLWLWGCFLTSSLIATLAISLTMPISMIIDVLIRKVEYPCIFYLGIIPMTLAFLTVSLLSHFDDWDPALDFVKKLYIWLCYRGKTIRIPDIESEQTESLIGANSAEHEA